MRKYPWPASALTREHMAALHHVRVPILKRFDVVGMRIGLQVNRVEQTKTPQA
jgi:hypothetical protein